MASRGTRSRIDRKKKVRRPLAIVGAMAMVVSSVVLTQVFIAGATHAGLDGSNFEITDGNLKLDDPDGHDDIDWVSVVHTGSEPEEIREPDEPSGSDDDALGGGSKEDTACPTVVDGSIPPNKSDLKTFGLYLEENTAGDFLHLFWTRVQDPKGTTNMDFEFNQNDPMTDDEDPTNDDDCGNGVTPDRTAGDVLITYNLSKGGTVPAFFLHRWLTGAGQDFDDDAVDDTCEASNSFPCWSAAIDLTGAAEGSVNTTEIPFAQADGLVDDPTGQLDPFTFGEGSIDLSAVFPSDDCFNLGSAYLKSRSSDSFTSALKDFIAPTPVDITNCGSIKIIKQNSEGDPLEGSRFTLFNDEDPKETIKNGGTDPLGDAWRDPTQVWPSADGDEQTFLTEDVDGDDPSTESTNEAEAEIDVDEPDIVSIGGFIFVNGELMEITAKSGDTLTVTRGDDEATHLSGDTVYLAVPGEDTAATTGDSGSLDSAISATDTTIELGDDEGAAFPTGEHVVQIGDELILIDSRSGDTLTVATNGRGYAGTTASSHSLPAEVNEVHSCAPTGETEASCTLTNVFFDEYWVVETTVPFGYTGADPQSVNLTETNSPVTLTFLNVLNPVDISVTKQTDDSSESPSPVPICFDDTEGDDDITEGCAEFELHDRPNTELATAISGDPDGEPDSETEHELEGDTEIEVDDVSVFPTTPFDIVVHDSSLGNAETLTVTGVTNGTTEADPDTLTLSDDASMDHVVDSVVSLLPDFSGTPAATCDPADATEAAAGECTFGNIDPGDYWIHESTQPGGYGVDSSLPKAITVSLGDTDSAHDYTFTNPRLFTVIVLVCSEATGTFYPSTVTFQDEDKTTLDNDVLDDDLAGLEDEICAVDGVGGARYEGLTHGDYNDTDNAVDIPQNQS